MERLQEEKDDLDRALLLDAENPVVKAAFTKV